MEAGRLDRKITIESIPETQNPAGEAVPGTPVVVATLWGQKTRSGGGEGQVADQPFAVGRYHWQLRYVAGVIPKMVLNDNGVLADILEVDETGRRQGELHLEVIERGV